MFSNAKHTLVENSRFTINTTNINPGQTLGILYNRVAPNAILNAGGRADEVRCHPGTRKEVIGRIAKWRRDAHGGVTASRIFWLSGPAGAGKTAIVQTVAKSWKSRGILAANFFFFRTDSSRNHPNALVSTLLYQIFDFYPAAREAVEQVLAVKPRILEASLTEQFDQLICSPLRSIGGSFSQPIVLLIDGLDECDPEEKTSQQQILHALDTLVSQSDLPFLVLVGSRIEHHITMAFRQLRSDVDSIFLDSKYSPEKDIRVFVTAEFDKIKRAHPLAPQDESWPSVSDIDDIVSRSSGQFIYATTVMRFISQSSADPVLSLSKVRGTARIATKLPFSHLDAMYAHILSQAEDQDVLKAILCTHALIRDRRVHQRIVITVSQVTMLEKVLRLYNHRYTNSDIHSCIADITAIARIETGGLTFYHSSLQDYLETYSRSGLDIKAFVAKILPGLWKLAGLKDHTVYRLVDNCVAKLADSKTLTPDMWGALLSLDPSDYEECLPLRLDTIYNHCVSDGDVENYRRILRRWIDHYMLADRGPTLALDYLYRLPHAARYTTMARIDHLHGDVTQNPDIRANALCPETAFDAQETALWVQNLLWNIHGEYYPHSLDMYNRLVGQWTSWALSNDVTLTNIDNLSFGQQ